MDEVMQLMVGANAQCGGKDAGVHEVLGVLYNVSKDYDSAIGAFQEAVNMRPDDYTLWNKLGATRANSNKVRLLVVVYRGRGWRVMCVVCGVRSSIQLHHSVHSLSLTTYVLSTPHPNPSPHASPHLSWIERRRDPGVQ